MDMTLPSYITIERGESTSICTITLGRVVQQPVEYGVSGDGIRGGVGMAKKPCASYDISLLVGNIFGSQALDSADVWEGQGAWRGGGFGGGYTSDNNSRTTIDFFVGLSREVLHIEFETEMENPLDYIPPWSDKEKRQVITIKARNKMMETMLNHPEFLDICSVLRAGPAARYKPRAHEFKMDIGRPVFQPMAGVAITGAAAQGDVAVVLGRIYGERILHNVETATERPRRTRKIIVKPQTLKYQGLEIKRPEPVPDQMVESTHFSEWNIVREFTFKSEGKPITACFETAFKAGEPDPLPAEDAAARQVITIKGPKDLVEMVSGYGGLEALCTELRERDVATLQKKVAAATTAPIPDPKTPRGYGPRFPKRTESGVDERQPCFSDGISVPPRFRDERQGGFHDDGRGRFERDRSEVLQIWKDGHSDHKGLPGASRRERDNRRPFREGDFVRPPARFRQPEPPKSQSKPPANTAEGIARLTMKPTRLGYDRLGRRTR